MEFPQAANFLIARGSIFHTFDTKSNLGVSIDHGKFFVIIGESKDSYIGAFFVNSNINLNVIKHKIQAELQYELKKEDYPFLSKDVSYLNCASLLQLSKSELVNSINCKNTQFKASLLKPHLDEILDKLQKSPMYSKAVKDKYFK